MYSAKNEDQLESHDEPLTILLQCASISDV